MEAEGDLQKYTDNDTMGINYCEYSGGLGFDSQSGP